MKCAICKNEMLVSYNYIEGFEVCDKCFKKITENEALNAMEQIAANQKQMDEIIENDVCRGEIPQIQDTKKEKKMDIIVTITIGNYTIDVEMNDVSAAVQLLKMLEENSFGTGTLIDLANAIKEID